MFCHFFVISIVSVILFVIFCHLVENYILYFINLLYYVILYYITLYYVILYYFCYILL